MKNLFAIVCIALFLSSCGGVTKEERKEMNEFEDSIKNDTSVNVSVDATNDFLNNDSITVDSVAVAPIE